MKNIFISNLHEKDVEHCTTDVGLYLRRIGDKPFKKLCNAFTNANIIRQNDGQGITDEEYFESLDEKYIPAESYDIKPGKNNIVVERYPELNENEPYIFVCNHTCPEDIETVLNVLDRNAYLILGSIESLQYNPEMYLSFLNGMIPFDIMDQTQRKQVLEKMKRVLKSNSILIFPEGSHNYSPNNLVNKLFDGPVNLALQTSRKIVIVTLIKDNEKNVAYIDVSNPVDVNKIDVDMNREFTSDDESKKHYIKSLTSSIRDKMATAVYHLMQRHFPELKRDDHDNLEEELRMKKISDAFKQLKWDRDVFDAEYLIKKSSEDKDFEEVAKTMYDLLFNLDSYVGEGNKEWVLRAMDIQNKDVVNRMRQHWLETQNNPKDEITLSKKKY